MEAIHPCGGWTLSDDRSRGSDSVAADLYGETMAVLGSPKRARGRSLDYDRRISEDRLGLHLDRWRLGEVLKGLGFKREFKLGERLLIFNPRLSKEIHLLSKRQTAHKEPNDYKAPADPSLQTEAHEDKCNWPNLEMSIKRSRRP